MTPMGFGLKACNQFERSRLARCNHCRLDRQRCVRAVDVRQLGALIAPFEHLYPIPQTYALNYAPAGTSRTVGPPTNMEQASQAIIKLSRSCNHRIHPESLAKIVMLNRALTTIAHDAAD